MWWTALVPFLLQALFIGVDEKVYHLKRGLPLWERIGHPLDTFTVLICMGYVLWVPFTKETAWIYGALALFSTLFVTKDEFVHKEHCPAQEQWLHAVLFTNHPVTLAITGFIWPVIQGVEVSPWISRWLNQPDYLHLFLRMQFAMMSLFLIYQVIYWNVLWKSTTTSTKN